MTTTTVRRRGFTLIEVTVALIVAALVALTAHQIFRAGVETARTVAQGRRSLDHGGNVHRFLAAAFLSVDVATAGQPAFDGEPDRVRFATWLATPDGWFEPVAMTIRLAGSDLIAQADTGAPLVLADQVAAVRFDYLMDYGADESWIARWTSTLRVPLGVRLRIYREVPAHAQEGGVVGDTLLFSIAERR